MKLLLFAFVVYSYGSSIAHSTSVRKYNVSEAIGIDSRDCLLQNDTKPCKTILYIYDYVLQIRNQTFNEVDINILDDYHLNETLMINRSSMSIKSLKIYSNFGSHIVAAKDNVSIEVGDKESMKTLGYTVIFKYLLFTSFGFRIPAALIVWTTDIVVESSKFLNNTCAALNILNSNVLINNCSFHKNSYRWQKKVSQSFPFGSSPSGGAVGIIYSRKSFHNTSITNCIFRNNQANTSDSRTILLEQEDNIAFYHTGGGLLLAFINVSNNNYVMIKNNSFVRNQASLGGGMMIAFYGKSGYNKIIVENTNFTENVGNITGGGFFIAAWQRASNNHVSFINLVISRNKAQVGGGGKVLFRSRNITNLPSVQYIKFHNVLFLSNIAVSSSGLHLIYNLQLMTPLTVYVIFSNVSFTRHRSSKLFYQDSNVIASSYSGVLLSNGVNICFQKSNYFFDNMMESPLYVSNAFIKIEGHLEFSRNYAQSSGGGMALTDVSHVFLTSGSSLLFQDNFAQIQGGAMYIQTIGFPDMVYKHNPSCFIQYSDPDVPPSQWNVSVEFVRNGAGLKGAAIFTNTLTPCIWTNTSPYYNFTDALNWKGIFRYEKNYLTAVGDNNTELYPITTDTTHYSVQLDENQAYAPGEEIKFSITASDEVTKHVYSVPVASISAKENTSVAKREEGVTLKDPYFIVQWNEDEQKILQYKVDEEIYGDLENGRNISFKVQFVDSYSSFRSNSELSFKAMKCKPGFKYRSDQHICVCETGNKNIKSCDNDVIYMEEGYWAGVSHGKLVVATCPYGYCKCWDKTGCSFNQSNPDAQCSSNRKGILCGKCKNGYGLSANKCIECKDLKWEILWFTFVIIVLIVIVVLVLIFNPKFSSHFRGILFFIQMLPYVWNPDTSSKTVLDVIRLIDLGGSDGLPGVGCIGRYSFTSLDVISIGYLYPGIIFVVLTIIYILHKFRAVNFRRNSPFQSFWILIVAMYKFLVETSLLLLYCVKLPQYGTVFFYDGTIQCYKNEHLYMTIIAAAVLLFLVLPPPILVPLIVYGYIPVGPVISDGLSQGLRKHVRWWWSVDFLRRVVVISIFVFVSEWTDKQTMLIIAFIFILTMHVQMKPYRNKQANHGETFLLLCLTCITVIEAMLTKNNARIIPLNVIGIAASLYCLLIAIYLFVTFIFKLCRSHGNFLLEDQVDSNEEGFYNESIKRRITVGVHERRSFSTKMTEDSDKKTGSHNVIVPTPVYTRSDFPT